MKTVLNYFEEIMSIPRESGKEEKIKDYLVNYAKEHNIEYSVGMYNTVFFRKNNHSDKTIILQAHSDMVCVSNEDYDFDNLGIPFYIDGDYYKSKCTSLGADDGIGLALILAILEEKDNMPNIEAIITTQEETTMLGASNFDYSKITGKTLINLDGTTEGDIEASCAGIISITINKKITYNENNNSYKLVISGLAGGHSGDAIDKGRCNAIKLAFKLLNDLDYTSIIDINIGKRDNVIPSDGYIVFSSNNTLEELNNKLKNINLSLVDDDKDLSLVIEECDKKNKITESLDIYNFINDIPNGLLKTYEDNFPLISSNIGSITISNNNLEIKYSIRSSDTKEEDKLLSEINMLTDKYNFIINIDSRKPFFPFEEKSIIRELLKETYKELYGKDATIKKIHACMEGGILKENIKDVDICTIAPTMEDIHSVNERVSISSTKRVYEWLKETLKKYNSRGKND